jgi:cellulose synthase/poly-beta-1,6-N-acetylglucosamine synthase-like glycosyltransferase
MMLAVLIMLVLLAVLMDFIALILWKTPSKMANKVSELPGVSVLIPMRNEAVNVKGLVSCIKLLDYPSEKIEILIGEDRSEDRTRQLLEQEIGNDSRFKIISIERDIAGLKAKANVVAQLIPHCNTSFYFITDADVSVPKSWISALLPYHTNNTGVIGGTTVVRVQNLWSGLQNIDWLIAQGLLFVAGSRFKTLAVSGTNMMITRTVCQAIGGYHKIPYSLTEDIGMVIAARNSGFSIKSVLTPGATAVIEAQANWASLISQRTRWIYGAFRLPKFVVLLLLLRTLFLFFIIVIAWYQPTTAIIIYLSKVLIDWIFVSRVARHLDGEIHVKHFICFEVFSCLISTSGLLRYLFSTHINWKGRNY